MKKKDWISRALDAVADWVAAWLNKHCPEGYEDETGFHYGKEKPKI